MIAHMLDARSIAHAAGGDFFGRTALIPGPGHSNADRSLSVTVSGDDFVVYSHAGDDPMQCRDYVRELLGMAPFRPGLPRHEHRRDPAPLVDDRRTEWALKLWSDGRSPAGTLVETYLGHRAIALSQVVLDADALRFHPACPFSVMIDGVRRTRRYPAMLGLFRNSLTGEPRSVHRTALKVDGSGKADDPLLGDPKKMLGPSRGCSIRLFRIDGGAPELGVAEGIETSLSAAALFGMPVWAAGSAPGVRGLPVIETVERISIYSDTDAAGFAAAKGCALTWRDAGRAWRIVRPPRDGVDWNDVAMEQA